MSSTPEQQRLMEELSSLPADDSRRREFVSTLSRLDGATQSEWLGLVGEAEILRGALHQINPPADLHARLLALPDQGAATIKPARTVVRVRRLLAAAAVLVVVGLGGYEYWRQSQPAGYEMLPAAPQEAVDAITVQAVNTHVNAAPLEVESSNREEVRAALQAKMGKGMPFAVIVPNPGANYRLLGGSVSGFGSGKAVETRWESKDQVYTLLQFAPGGFGMPHEFATVREYPATQQVALMQYSVAIWPGKPEGVCTWAVVRDRKAAADPFSVITY
jgi:anti-sigma factor RsiW